MNKQEKLRKHLSDALDILWMHYGNGWGTEKEKLIAEIHLEIERLDADDLENKENKEISE